MDLCCVVNLHAHASCKMWLHTWHLLQAKLNIHNIAGTCYMLHNLSSSRDFVALFEIYKILLWSIQRIRSPHGQMSLESVSNNHMNLIESTSWFSCMYKGLLVGNILRCNKPLRLQIVRLDWHRTTMDETFLRHTNATLNLTNNVQLFVTSATVFYLTCCLYKVRTDIRQKVQDQIDGVEMQSFPIS